MKNINWYPGHMKKTREMIAENLKLVDVVIEVVDARIPISSRNPIVDDIISGKPSITVFNKSDLADEMATEDWINFTGRSDSLKINSMSGQGIKELFRMLEKFQAEKNRQKQNTKPVRIMIVGVPNVGKSSLINRMTGKKSTRTGDRPGVTRGKQWLTLSNGMQLLDTPGVLWPKFEDPHTGLNLAFCGSIKDEILDIADIGLELIKKLNEDYHKLLSDRYGLEAYFEEGSKSSQEEDDMYEGYYDQFSDDNLLLMEEIARKRGCILSGKRIDYDRCARMVLDDFRSGRIGKITLEKAGDSVD